MYEIILQFSSLIVFVLGIFAGEALAYRVFGRPRSALVYLIDIVMMVFIISLMYSYIGFYEQGIVYYVTNFLIGMFAILIVRAVEWSFKLTESGVVDESKTVDIIRLLAHYGLGIEEIKKALKVFGCPPRTVDKYSMLIEKTVPIYLPRLVKIEKAIERMERKIGKIEKRLK